MSAGEFHHHEGYTEGRLDGYLDGLRAARAMADQQAAHEGFLGEIALDRLSHELADRIAAGGCPDWKDAS